MNTNFDKYRGQINSLKGGWTMGEGIITHGYSLLDDIHGKCSMFQVMIMNVTGRLPEKRLADLVEGVYICSSWPDTRIWCNKIGVFCALTKTSPTTAIAAGGLAGNSKIYGPGTGLSIGPFLQKAYDHIISNNDSVGSFIEKQCYKNGSLVAPGFARPLAKGDERIPAMRILQDKLGFDDGPYTLMTRQMEEYLNKKAGEGLNLSGYFTAFMLDQGFNIEEIMGITAFAVSGGVYAAYFEYINQSPNSFLPLRVNDIEYIGPEARKVPKRM
jgi:citrate synthase